MTSAVRAPLYARPKFQKCGCFHAPVDNGRGRCLAKGVADLPLDAVVVDEVPRTDRVRVIRKGAVLNALLCSHPVAPEAVHGVQQNGLGKGAHVVGLLPVPGLQRSVNQSPDNMEVRAETYG